MTPEVRDRIEQIRHGNVPEGYKKTKLGIVPNEWDEKRIGDILRRRKTLMCISEDTPLLSFTIAEGVIEPEDKKSNKRDFLIKDMSTKKFALTEINDIIYNPANLKFGAIPRNNLRKGLVSPIYGVFYGAQNPFFIGHLFRTQKFIDYAKVYTEGTVEKLKTLSADTFLQLKIPLPPIKEQEKIAEILTTQDKVIELKEKKLAEKLRLKKQLYHKLFVQNISCMERIKLSEVCSINDESISDRSIQPPFYYIDISCVEEGRIAIPQEKVAYKEAPVRARRKIKKKDILMSTVRPYLHAFAIVDFDAEDCIASTGFAVLRPRDNDISDLIYHQLVSEDMDKQFSNLLVGTNYPAINTSDVCQLKIWIPKQSKDCARISGVLAASEQELNLLRRDLEQEKEKKKALMQLLLTGIVRV